MAVEAASAQVDDPAVETRVDEVRVDDPAVEAKAVVVGALPVPAARVDATSLAPNPKR